MWFECGVKIVFNAQQRVVYNRQQHNCNVCEPLSFKSVFNTKLLNSGCVFFSLEISCFDIFHSASFFLEGEHLSLLYRLILWTGSLKHARTTVKDCLPSSQIFLGSAFVNCTQHAKFSSLWNSRLLVYNFACQAILLPETQYHLC